MSKGVVRLVTAGVLAIGLAGCSTDALDPGASIESILIAPSSATVAVGASLSLNAEVRDADGQPIPGRRVTWSSENPSIAEVSSTGTVTGIGTGTVMIAASALGKDAFSLVTVNPTPVASVRLSIANRSLQVGEALQLTADALDAGGLVLAGRRVTWTSSNSEVATVTNAGLVTAVAQGGAIITATAEARSGSASITVSLIPVATVSIGPVTSNVVVGQNAQLIADVRSASGASLTDRVVVWTTSRAQVATVSSSGVVTANAVGTATITATSEGKDATATINVSPRPVSAVIVSPGQVNITVGQTAQLNAAVTDNQGQPLTGRAISYSSNNALVATVSGSGLVTGVSPGSVTITATSEGTAGTATVTIAPQPVASVSISPSPASVIIGSGLQLLATTLNAAGQPLTGRTVSWRSGAPGLASVTATGFVTGLSPGTAVIIATVDGTTGSATVTVSLAAVAIVSVTPATATTNVGQTLSLTATLRDINGGTLTGRVVAWTSSSNGIATVSADGVVTGVAAGSVTISASSGSATGSATINVQLAPVNRVVLTPTNPEIKEGESVQLTATLYDAQNNVLSGRPVTWSSADASKVTVDSNGLARGIKRGTVPVTASSGSVSGATDVKVK